MAAASHNSWGKENGALEIRDTSKGKNVDLTEQIQNKCEGGGSARLGPLEVRNLNTTTGVGKRKERKKMTFEKTKEGRKRLTVGSQDG